MENLVYLEFIDEKSSKFYQVEWTNTAYTVTYGRIGSNGSSKTITCDNVVEEVEKLIASKKKKGYCDSLTQKEPIILRSYDKTLDVIYNSLNVSDEDVIQLDKFAKLLSISNLSNKNVLFSFILTGCFPSEIIGSGIEGSTISDEMKVLEEEMVKNNYQLNKYAGFNDWKDGFTDFMYEVQSLVNLFDNDLELNTKNFFNPNKVEGFNEKYEDKDEDFFLYDIEYDEDEEDFYGEEGVFTFLESYSNLKKIGYAIVELPSDGDNILFSVVKHDDYKKFDKAMNSIFK